MLRGVATIGTIPKRLSNYDILHFKGVSYQWSGCGSFGTNRQTQRHLVTFR